MPIKETIESQYLASLAMLNQAVEACPASLWVDRSYENPFWHVTYHVLFYTHLYLAPSEKEFVPWEKHKDSYRSLGSPEDETKNIDPLTKKEIADYIDFCRREVGKQVPALNLEDKSGFDWLPFEKFEVQIYNIRHIQQHTGELYERLGADFDDQIGWVGRRPD